MLIVSLICGIPQKIKEQFRATGVVHVLALYGLHIQVL
jgi:predicted membrane metal-binding protein